MSWSKGYKKSINCSNPKGFSQKAHCAGRKARQRGEKTQSKSVSEMKVSQLKEQIRGIIRERSVKAIQKDYSNVVSDMEKHLELYKKSKGTPEEKKHIGHLKDLTAKKKKLQAELDLAVAALYKNAELKVDEAITNPKKTNPSDLAKTVLGWFDFYTDYIDDGGQRRRAIKNNDDVLVWFGSHPKDVKEKAYKIMVSQAKSEKGQVERTFGKHLNESVNESKLTAAQLPFKFLFNYPSGGTSRPSNFEDWYRDGMQLKSGKAIERFSPEDDKKLRSLIRTWWDEVDDTSIEDFNLGRDNKYIKKVKKDILDFLIQKSKVIKESVNEGLYHVGYNKGRGQGTGVFKDSYSSYKDAKKAVEKLEKERGGSYNMVAYYVSDKDGKFVKESVTEAKSDYEVYHKSYTSAINAAKEYAEKKGYEINDDDSFRQIGMGPRKPSEGKTNKFSIELSKDGKVQRKKLQIQVYGMKNSYELNAYIQ